ncbi:DnAK-TPR [Besnoitia besnoiti]|uniref:DnAK-TPR n=1 Tax=Besnoitia besnoiti TaxID=94643 RepID=A0A2A9MBK8_BESBE|nr:DnAK-TPR [Besnoitia besnoiti]PFH32780.1 DnAK-TPR [Besnoitia besnoiti]
MVDDSKAVMGIDLGAHLSVFACGALANFDETHSAETNSGIKKAYVPSCISFDDKILTYGAEAEARVNYEPKNLVMNIPMWLGVHDVRTARELEDRVAFCPYPHVTIDQGKVLFRVAFGDKETHVPLPLAIGFFLEHLLEKGNTARSTSAENEILPLVRGFSRSLRIFSRDAADGIIRPPEMAAIVLPSSVDARAIREAEVSAKMAGLTVTMLRRIDAIVNFWACEKLPQEYHKLVDLQKRLDTGAQDDQAVRLAVIDIGFAETSMAVVELSKSAPEEAKHQPQKEVLLKVLSNDVDRALGFVEVIRAVATHVAAHVEKKYNAQIRSHSKKCWRLHLACIRAIRELNDLPETVIDMENFILENTDLRMDCTLKHFEGLCEPLKERFKKFFERVIYSAGIDAKNIVAVDLTGVSGAARMPWLTDLIERFFGSHDGVDPQSNCKVRRTIDTSAAAAIGAGYFCAGKKYVASLVNNTQLGPYDDDDLREMRALRDEMIEIEAKELRRRAMKAKLQLYVHELRAVVDSPKRDETERDEESSKLLQDADAFLANISTEPYEEVKKIYDRVRSFFERTYSRVYNIVERKATGEGEEGGKQDKRDMIHVLNQLEGDAAKRLSNTLCVRRAHQDYREALNFIEGGQFELSGYLLKRGLTFLDRVKTSDLKDDDVKEISALKASIYVQLAKSECFQADEDGAIDAREQLLRDAVENCTKALELDTKREKAYLYRARAHLQLGDYREASEDAKSGELLAPADRHLKKIQEEIKLRIRP